LFNANSAIFHLYHDENKLIFNEMMMSLVGFVYSAGSLKQQSAHLIPLNTTLPVNYTYSS